MPSPLEPEDPGTGDADSPLGGSPPGGGRRTYAWIIGLIAVAAVLSAVSLLIGGTEGAPPASR